MHNIFNKDFREMQFSDNMFTGIITDPPYGLKYLNNKWDYNLPSKFDFEEMLRILKPGGNIFCFGGTRTFHKMMVNMEDAGFYIDNTIAWIYGSGFPKSVDISYMIDKNRGTFGEIKETLKKSNSLYGNKSEIQITEPGSLESAKWYGWLTNLSPAWEPIICAHKPIEGNWDDNAINHGVAGYWIDGARIGNEEIKGTIKRTQNGRYPKNVIFDEESIKELQNQNNDACRFFYCAKPNKKEREGNTHPTVKPLDLMRYIATLAKTPDGGLIFDPYMGSGTTLVVCNELDIECYGTEINEEYFKIAQKRLDKIDEKCYNEIELF